MRILIIHNQTNSKISPNLFHLFGTVSELRKHQPEAHCDVLCLGHELNDIPKEVANFQAVDQVLVIDHHSLKNILAEDIAPTVADIIKDYTHVLVAADSFGKNLLPRVAGILQIGQISELVTIVNHNTFEKFTYAGNALITVESLEEKHLLTVRTNNFALNKQKHNGNVTNNVTVSKIAYTAPAQTKVKFVKQKIVDTIDLGNAKVIVSGGKSLGSKEEFDRLIRPLAEKLNAGVGATRAAVDAGYAHNDCQVGQTGKVVAPQLYIAIGISGAVQHIAGMKDSQTVIAINTDPNAPIFEHADYGFIGDLFTITPQLLAKL